MSGTVVGVWVGVDAVKGELAIDEDEVDWPLTMVD